MPLTIKEFDKLIADFLNTQDDTCDEEWWCTRKDVAVYVTGDLRIHLFSDLESKEARRLQYEELKKRIRTPTDRRTQSSSAQNNKEKSMTNGKSTLLLDLFIATSLAQALSPKPDQMNQGTGAKPTVRVFSDSDPAFAKDLQEMFNATKDDLTYGEQLIGYDPDKKYDPALAELLQNFADSIDILHNCKGTTPPAIRATETAIGHIQTACFWAQNAMTASKL